MSETIQTKRCSKCKQFKPISEFYRDQRRKDGHRSLCKVCHSKITKDYYQTKKGKEVNRKAESRYAKTEKGKAKKKRYRQRNPEQVKARNAVIKAIKDGKLPRLDNRLCHYCPKPAQEYHHWHGYEKEHWLDVVPACIPCHGSHRKS